MPNYFEKRREELNLNRTEIAARMGTTAETVRQVEAEIQHYARIAIADVAIAYEVTEQKAGEEMIALRRRIEARRAKSAVAAQ